MNENHFEDRIATFVKSLPLPLKVLVALLGPLWLACIMLYIIVLVVSVIPYNLITHPEEFGD